MIALSLIDHALFARDVRELEVDLFRRFRFHHALGQPINEKVILAGFQLRSNRLTKFCLQRIAMTNAVSGVAASTLSVNEP